MTELKYKNILEAFLLNKLEINRFMQSFMEQWRIDRDNEVFYDDKFQRLIDRIFTTCDCYSPVPEGDFEINEKQLKDEIGLLFHIWFG